MAGSPWIDLLKRIPPEKHNQLSLVTQSGTEIVIQAIFVMEGDNFVFKGRMSGSQDTGRAFFVPFAQIDYLCTLDPIPEEQLHGWFNSGPEEAQPQRPRKSSYKGEVTPDEDDPIDPINSESGLHQLNARQTALLEKVRARSPKAKT